MVSWLEMHSTSNTSACRRCRTPFKIQAWLLGRRGCADYFPQLNFRRAETLQTEGFQAHLGREDVQLADLCFATNLPGIALGGGTPSTLAAAAAASAPASSPATSSAWMGRHPSFAEARVWKVSKGTCAGAKMSTEEQ